MEKLAIVPPVEDEKGKISSNNELAHFCSDGDVKESRKHLLGQHTPLPTRGMVVFMEMPRGRTIGYPTANLVLRDRTLYAADGVYVKSMEVQRQRYRGMASVGKNVTDGEEPRFEVNIFDFSG